MSGAVHTPMLVDGATVYQLSARDVNRVWATVQPGYDDDGKRVKDAEAQQVAARLALCWNTHDELVAALTGALESMESGVTSLGVIRAARAALSRATSTDGGAA